MKAGVSFAITDFTEFRNKMLNWVKQFNIFCLLENHQYQTDKAAFECLLGVGVKVNIVLNAGNAFEQLQQFRNEEPGWLFGHLGYDLKNETENLSSLHPDHINFPDTHFFAPEIVLQLSNNKLVIFSDEENEQRIYEAINNTYITSETNEHTQQAIAIQGRISKESYVDTIKQLQQHILRGDCYEVNFCQEFFAADALIDPFTVYQKLIALSPNPFSAFYRFNDKYCLCASPERYLKKEGNKIFSQPIKGTAKRNLEDTTIDEMNKQELLQSEKEKSENVMVVDLVRNDLSKVCKEGTVKVDELFGLYTFPQVHQMISTISGELKEGIEWTDIVKATFPMGSMTGAPKRSVMELIEQHECSKRGLFSGAIGYLSPNNDFDFNVVIRSILYNQQNKYLSFQAGSAITFYADAEAEYEECLVKVQAMRQVLS